MGWGTMSEWMLYDEGNGGRGRGGGPPSEPIGCWFVVFFIFVIIPIIAFLEKEWDNLLPWIIAGVIFTVIIVVVVFLIRFLRPVPKKPDPIKPHKNATELLQEFFDKNEIENKNRSGPISQYPSQPPRQESGAFVKSCPNCGKFITIIRNSSEVTCPHCGTEFYLNWNE